MSRILGGFGVGASQPQTAEHPHPQRNPVRGLEPAFQHRLQQTEHGIVGGEPSVFRLILWKQRGFPEKFNRNQWVRRNMS